MALESEMDRDLWNKRIRGKFPWLGGTWGLLDDNGIVWLGTHFRKHDVTGFTFQGARKPDEQGSE